jgi:hypothetical protein
MVKKHKLHSTDWRNARTIHQELSRTMVSAQNLGLTVEDMLYIMLAVSVKFARVIEDDDDDEALQLISDMLNHIMSFHKG